MGGLIRKLGTRQFWRPIIQCLFLMATGAWLLIAYMTTRMPVTDQLRDLSNDVHLEWCILSIAWCVSAPRNNEADHDLSPARSGTTVVAVCGIAAAIFLSRDADWPEGLVVPGLILLSTAVIALFVYRFASRHASEIGEARFNTMASSRHRDSR
jgi:hypothetical protein